MPQIVPHSSIHIPASSLRNEFVGDATGQSTSLVAKAIASVHNSATAQMALSASPTGGNDRTELSPDAANAGTANTERTAASDGVYSFDGKLTQAAIDWINQQGLTPARAAFGPCSTTSAGIFCFLATGEQSKAQRFFDRVIQHGVRNTWANSNVVTEFRMLRGAGLDARADLYLADHAKGMAANERLTGAFPGLVTEHGFDREALTAQVFGLKPGEAAVLYVDNTHAISFARDSAVWHVFDTDLNPAMNTYPGAQEDLEFDTGQSTPDGRNHVTGSNAEALLRHYLHRIESQPVLVRIASY